jgi:phosphate transport system permease protein
MLLLTGPRGPERNPLRSPLRNLRENAIRILLLLCALVSVLTTFGIIYVLISQSIPFFRHVSLVAFLTGTRWTPLLEPRSFGGLPLIAATIQIGGGALLIAVPLGLCTAIYLSEYAPAWVRQIAKPFLEILAGIPTVVYGYFALTFITPEVLRRFLPQTEIYNAASASIVVGIMIIPTISSLCDDAFRAVPRSLREGAYAVAATKLEVSTRVVLPAAMSGVMAAVLLALSRAIGETMAVVLAAGMTPKLTWNPLESAQTMTAYIVQVSLGDTAAGTIEYQSIFAVGLALFVITLAINLVAQRVLRRFREVYE